MARSNRSKYKNLDYVLMGKPGARRWHKRQEVAPTKRLDIGISFLDSSAALYNRNRREVKVFKRAMSLPQKEEYRKERRRGMVRAIAYGGFVGIAVATSLYSIARMHRVGNAKLIEQASEDLAANIKKRSRGLIGAIEFTERSRDSLKTLASNKKIDFTPEMPGGFVDAQRIVGNTSRRVKNGLHYPIPRGELETLRDGISDSQKRINEVAAQLYSAIKSTDNSPKAVKYRNYARNVLKRIQSTNIDEILKSDKAFMDTISNDKELAKTVRRVNGNFENLSSLGDWEPVSADELYKNIASREVGFNGKTLAESPLDADSAMDIAKGIRDDITDAFFRRKRAVSAALRAGDPPPKPGYATVPYKYRGKNFVEGKRKRPLFMGNTKVEAAGKVAKGLAQALNPIPKSKEGWRVVATTTAGVGATVGVAHAAAQLANTASTAYLQNVEDREHAEDTRFREALVINRLRSEYEKRGGSRQAKVALQQGRPNIRQITDRTNEVSRRRKNVGTLLKDNRNSSGKRDKKILSEVNRALTQNTRR